MKNFSSNNVIVLIPTKNRPSLLERALKSVNDQKCLPSLIVVVNDSDEPYVKETQKVVESFKPELLIIEKINDRTRSLSGAVNSGLEVIKKMIINVENYFIAFLDDDDWWDPTYIQECSKIALDGNYDWIISGIVRYDKKNPNGWNMPIPNEITRSMIFIGNPNVQGSNLFLKLSLMVKINGFDEYLISSTDRDICIRLLEVTDIKIGYLNRHLVHHWAMDDYNRLSTAKTTLKEKGLQLFYQKYKSSMTEKEQVLFKERVRNYFLIDL